MHFNTEIFGMCWNESQFVSIWKKCLSCGKEWSILCSVVYDSKKSWSNDDKTLGLANYRNIGWFCSLTRIFKSSIDLVLIPIFWTSFTKRVTQDEGACCWVTSISPKVTERPGSVVAGSIYYLLEVYLLFPVLTLVMLLYPIILSPNFHFLFLFLPDTRPFSHLLTFCRTW